MVAAEEEPMDTTSHTNDSENHNDTNDGSGKATTREVKECENQNYNYTSQQHDHNGDRSRDKKEKQKNHSSSNDNKYNTHSSLSKHSNEKCKSSSSKEKGGSHKDMEREKGKTDHKHEERDHNKEKERSAKKRDENLKSDKEQREQKLQSPKDTYASQSKSSSQTSSSKSKHESKYGDTSSSKDKKRHERHKSSSKDKEPKKEEKSSSHSTSSKDKTERKSSSSKSSNKDPDSAERKRRRNSVNDSTEFKSPQLKMAKVSKSSSSTPASKAESSPNTEEDGIIDSFDSSMGANFDDVLGMLNMPVKKNKKNLKSPATPVNSGSSSTSKREKTSHEQSPTINSGSSVSNKLNGTKIANSTLYSTPSTSKVSAMKPDLLAPTAKLEPLDPSIALELPTISTNYKPMPLNQTVMDCVFNNFSSSTKTVRTFTDAEAITHGISSKTMRTKIYSGIRTGQTYQVPSLFDMCIRILQKNIDALEYTGGVPFEVLKPVLERATPHQLYIFEEYNPYLMEDSDVLWQQHVSRSYRTKKRLENESWREMFIRSQEEEERRLSVLKDSIKASQKIAAAPIRKTQLAFVDTMVKPPRNILRKQEQFGTKEKLVATPAARVASLSSVTPNVAKTGDQRLKVPVAVRDNAQVSTSSSIRPKKAPLMQKTLQFIRGRHKR